MIPISVKRFSSIYALGMLCSFQSFGEPLSLSEQTFPLYVTGDADFFLSKNTSILNVDASLSTIPLLGASGSLSIDGRNKALFINNCQAPQSGIPLILAGPIPNAEAEEKEEEAATPLPLFTLKDTHTFVLSGNTSFSTEGLVSAGSINWTNNKSIIVTKNSSLQIMPRTTPGVGAVPGVGVPGAGAVGTREGTALPNNPSGLLPSFKVMNAENGRAGAGAGAGAASPPTPAGGTIRAKEHILIANNSDTVYFGDNSSMFGGAIRMEEQSAPAAAKVSSTTTSNGLTLISNNEASVTFEGNKASYAGGAIFGGSAIFTDNQGSVQFIRNTSSCTIPPSSGTAAAAAAAASATDEKMGSGGAISLPTSLASFQNNKGIIVFNGNTATGDGGAIYAQTFQESGNTGSIIFADNTCTKKGGAIRAEVVSIEADSRVVFSNNKGNEGGGAIYVGPLKTTTQQLAAEGTVTFPGPSLSLSAKNGDLIFIGNMGKGSRNAITLDTGVSFNKLSASEGHTIAFFDPITYNNGNAKNGANGNSSLTINDGTTGRVLFSGKFAPKQDAVSARNTPKETDVQSKINANVTLAGGVLEITDGASLEVNQFTQTGGHIVIGSGSTLKASSQPTITSILVDLSTFSKIGTGKSGGGGSTQSDPAKVEWTNGSRLQTLESRQPKQSSSTTVSSTVSSIVSQNADIVDSNNSGQTTLVCASTRIPLIPPLPKISTLEELSAPTALTIPAAPLSSIKIVDTEGCCYYDKTFATEVKDVSLVSVVTTQQQEGLSLLADSEGTLSQPRTGTAYGYQGSWSITEESSTQSLARNSGTTKTIKATWSPDGNFFLPYNRRGELVPNTVWSTLAAIDSFSSTAYESPFEVFEGKKLVAEGIGSFMRGQAEKDSGRDGFQFEGGGYGVRFGSSYNGFSSGVSFGQIFGKTRSKLYQSKSTENAFLGTLYAAAPIPFLIRELETIFSFVLGYGFVENTMTTEYPENSVFTKMKTSKGKWDNRGAILRIRFTNMLPQKHFDSITPFSGLRELAFFFGPEFAGVRQSSFVERGVPSRSFEKGKGFVISLPVGIIYQAHLHMGKSSTYFQTSFTYKPDIYRDDPHTRLTLLESDQEYRVEGVPLARNAFRLDAQGTMKIHRFYEFSAGYTFEGRSSTRMHRASISLARVF